MYHPSVEGIQSAISEYRFARYEYGKFWSPCQITAMLRKYEDTGCYSTNELHLGIKLDLSFESDKIIRFQVIQDL